MDEGEERDLIARAKHDPEAFGMLYRRYVKRIYNYHYRHTGNPGEAEDLTSRTFYRALRSIKRYHDRKASFQAWLFRIAHNLLVNWYRDQSRRRTVPLEVEDLLANHQGPESSVEGRERRESLLQAIERLPEERKTLLVLKFTEQLSNTEIGAVLGKSEGAIKSLYHRTLLSLRTMLTEEAQNENPV
ncbi:MAG: sigma-70 family RNA polymerase sigma factor [Anaerolineae bacterium]|nr:sigma-70 family RNA polymerase sigma factor [Anaerolineae bacterium]